MIDKDPAVTVTVNLSDVIDKDPAVTVTVNLL